jgi:membrane associated rhomboid family serine protease
LSSIESKIVKHSFLMPLIFVSLLWLIAIVEHTLGLSFSFLGVYPRTVKGLPGILLMPFLHANFQHLFSNSVPLLVMGAGILYFYRSLSYRVFIIIWIISGVCVWLGGRPSYHIGASGIVYGLATFLFLSGAIRRIPRLAAISLVIVFLYGGLIWGVLPIWPTISWEGHLFGGIAGIACAILYKDKGPQRRIYSWELEEKGENKPEANLLESTTFGENQDEEYYLSKNSNSSVEINNNYKKS